MHILIFSNWFPPVVSGSSFYAKSLAQSLANRGHEVEVVTLDWGKEYAPSDDLSFPVHRLAVLRIPKSRFFYKLELMGYSFTPGNCRRLREIVEKFRPDILHHVNHIFDSTFLTSRIARKAKIPIVGSITTPIQNQNPFLQWIMGLADRIILGTFGVRHWDGIVSLDKIVHGYVGKLYGTKAQQRSVIIPFGVRLDRMSDYEHTSRSRSSRPQVLMVGHIHPFRNPVQLVRAMPIVLETIPKARLILAGRVDINEPIKVARKLALTSDQVQFIGPKSHSEVVSLMKDSHVFASWITGPYRALGTAPMEAMLCETPVINDIPEDLFGEGKLKNNENIALVDSHNPQSIAQAIIRLLKDEELRQKIGLGGRRFVLDHLNWQGIAAQIENLYESILTGKTR